MNPDEEYGDGSSFHRNNNRYIHDNQDINNIIEFSRPSFCIKCKAMTGHNTPARLIVIKNGRPAMSSFCWKCRSRKMRLVSYKLYSANTGRKLRIIVYVYRFYV